MNAKSNTGRIPLHTAATSSGAGAVEALLGACAKANAKDDKRVTPLHLAASNGQAGAVKALFTVGAKVNTRTAKDRLTPLDAARFGMEVTEEKRQTFQELIRTLKAHGARERRGR